TYTPIQQWVAEQSEVSRGHSTILTRERMGRTELLRKNEICTFGYCVEHRQSERTYLKEEAVNPPGTLGGWSKNRHKQNLHSRGEE
ncbi:hypothetical protein LRS37_16435, partial [Neobacillus sedimentimangrovi]